jgi:hypothetical protein
MKLPIIVLLTFFAVEQVWTAEVLDKARKFSEKAQAFGMQQTFSKYHEHTWLAQ